MKTLTCLVVEDEPLAAEILTDYIQQVPFLELKGVCADAIHALDFLQEQYVDVLFLDIHLPKLKGLDFLRSLGKRPQVILTTAYHQYALESYELGVVDYLLKPIEFSRFIKAIGKLDKGSPDIALSPPRPADRAFHFFNVNKQMHKVYLDEIFYIESLKEYIRVYTANAKLITKMQIGTVEEILPSDKFLRIHRSYIISIEQISAYAASEVVVGKHTLPVGRTYRDSVQNVLGNL